MKSLSAVVSVLIAVCVVTPASRAGKVKTWHHHRPADHERAQFQGVVMSSTGSMRLSRTLRSIAAGLDCTHVWSVAQDTSGRLIAATGDEGKVWRISREGKPTLLYTSEHSQVLSLACGKENTVYAGTGPTATIVRIDRAGGKVLCELNESYVWALALDARGEALYAATGPNGRIYRITLDGKASVFYETKQDHVMCLAVGRDGSVYAGTDKTGRIYRISPQGKGFVLYQVPQTEVRTLFLDGDVLYAGTAGTKKRPATSSSSSDSESKAQVAVEKTPRARADARPEKVRTASGKSASKSTEKSSGSSAPAPSSPAAGENCVFRIAADGSVREVFRGKLLVLALARQGKGLLVGTGMKGQLFEVNEQTSEKCEIARLDHGQVLSLCRQGEPGRVSAGRVILGVGDKGGLYALEDGFASKGSITSEVLDAKLVSRWGALRWRADIPVGTQLSVAVRSGNVAEPDETWSDWSDEQTSGESATVQAPAARYLQYRLTMTTENPSLTPVLRSLLIRYATTNQPPQVSKVEVPDLGSTTLENPKKLKFKWSATDANEDELRYQLYVKKDGWEHWVQLEDDHDKTDYEWDTTTTPSGVYRLKVVARDHIENTEKDALTGQRISEPFVVCHTPPMVTVKTAGVMNGRVEIQAMASSPLVRLTGASFAVNGKKWVSVLPADGLFDSRAETFRFRTEALPAGAYVLVLKVQDAAGNTGSSDVVFTVPARPVARK